MALTRLKELVAKIEAVPGTVAASLFAAGNAKHLVINPTASFTVPMFIRDIVRNSLTSTVGIPGIKSGAVGFQLEMAGHANATPDIPTWDLFMKACGFHSESTKSVAFTATTGAPLRHGETVTATGTGASGTAKIVHDTYPATTGGAGTAYLAEDTIVWATSGATTLTGGTTAGTLTVGAGVTSADAGQSWWPVSHAVVSITGTAGIQGTLVVGDVLKMSDNSAAGVVTYVSNTGGTDEIRVRLYAGWPNTGGTLKFNEVGAVGVDYFDMNASGIAVTQYDIPTLSLALIEDGVAKTLTGSRGTWSLNARVGEPVMMTFEFTGAASAVSDQAFMSGVVYESKTPPRFLSAGLAVGTEGNDAADDFFAQCITAVTLALGNTVSPRTCANNANGVDTYEVTARAGTGTMDPESHLEASHPIVQKFLDGTLSRIGFNVGTVAANRFKVTVPGAQTTSLGSGDREGIATRDWQFNLTGGTWTNASDTAGGDNELVITYLLT